MSKLLSAQRIGQAICRQPVIHDTRGAVAVTVAIVMVVLFSFAALALDISNAMIARYELQNVADASALAGARQLGVIYQALPSGTPYTSDMSATTTKQSRLHIAVGIVCAILVFQILWRILGIPVGPLRSSSYAFARSLYALSLMIVPAIAVTGAVLLARWVEDRLATAQRKTCVVWLVVVIVAILASHIRVLTTYTSVEATPEMLRRMGIEESSDTHATP